MRILQLWIFLDKIFRLDPVEEWNNFYSNSCHENGRVNQNDEYNRRKRDSYKMYMSICIIKIMVKPKEYFVERVASKLIFTPNC